MRSPEIRPLTGLRALLALWVVLQHFVRELLPEGNLQRILAGGHVSVHVFFVLSGYVLAVQYSHVDLQAPGERRRFWWRRVAKLYPLYLCSLLLGFFGTLPRSWVALQSVEGAARAVAQLFVLNAWWHVAMFPLNFAAWTLSVEMFFYMLFPALMPRMTRFSDRGLFRVVVVAVALTAVAPTLYTVFDPDQLGRPLTFNEDHLWSRYLNFGGPHRLPEFVSGIAAALLVQRGWLTKIRGSFVTAVLAGASLVLLTSLPLIPFAYIGGSVLLPIIVVLVVSLDHDRPSLLASDAAVELGRASYATYILHVPYFLTLHELGPHPEDMWQRPLDVAAYVVTLIPLALLAHRWVEVPLHRWLTRGIAAPRHGAAARSSDPPASCTRRQPTPRMSRNGRAG